METSVPLARDRNSVDFTTLAGGFEWPTFNEGLSEVSTKRFIDTRSRFHILPIITLATLLKKATQI